MGPDLWIVVLAGIISLGLLGGAVIGLIWLIRKAAGNNFGFIGQRRADGSQTYQLTLRGLLVWSAVLPALAGSIWWHFNAYAEEREAERCIMSKGGHVYRWPDALLFEHEFVYSVDLSESSAGVAEMEKLKYFPEMGWLGLGSPQCNEVCLQSLPKSRLSIDVHNVSIDETVAYVLSTLETRHLYLKKCTLTADSKDILERKFADKLQLVQCVVTDD